MTIALFATCISQIPRPADFILVDLGQQAINPTRTKSLLSSARIFTNTKENNSPVNKLLRESPCGCLPRTSAVDRLVLSSVLAALPLLISKWPLTPTFRLPSFTQPFPPPIFLFLALPPFFSPSSPVIHILPSQWLPLLKSHCPPTPSTTSTTSPPPRRSRRLATQATPRRNRMRRCTSCGQCWSRRGTRSDWIP